MPAFHHTSLYSYLRMSCLRFYLPRCSTVLTLVDWLEPLEVFRNPLVNQILCLTKAGRLVRDVIPPTHSIRYSKSFGMFGLKVVKKFREQKIVNFCSFLKKCRIIPCELPSLLNMTNIHVWINLDLTWEANQVKT